MGRLSKDVIGLYVSGAGLVLSGVAALFERPEIGFVLAAILLVIYVSYLVYVLHYCIPGNTLLRLAPAALLVMAGGVTYWVWPTTLTVVLYEDKNGDGRRDSADPAIQSEDVNITDANNVPRTVKTRTNGELSLRLPRGEVSLRIRGQQVLSNLKRGENVLQIGFLPREVKPPEHKMFVSTEPYVQTASETTSRKVYAHIWYHDKERPIKKLEVDWGDGRRWQEQDLSDWRLMYYVLPHEYTSAGPKRIKIRITNSGEKASPPDGVPGDRFVHLDHINIKQ